MPTPTSEVATIKIAYIATHSARILRLLSLRNQIRIDQPLERRRKCEILEREKKGIFNLGVRDLLFVMLAWGFMELSNSRAGI